MENNILVSVAMCTYNGENYVKEQIESILKQTISEIELIITDDCSTDNTIQIINNYMKNDSRIKLYQNKENLGYVKNFEKAISLCQGYYIALSDQDDVWESCKLEALIDFMIDKKGDFIYSNALLVDKNLNSLEKKLVNKKQYFQGENNLFFVYNNCISGNTMLFKNKLRDKFLPFPKNLDFHDIWIAFIASSVTEIIFFDKTLVYYRQHDNNVTNIDIKKASKSYIEKINKKKTSIDKLIYKLSNFEQFLKKNNINKNLEIISFLLKEFKNFESYFFNFKLFKIIYSNKNYLFPNKKVSILKILKISIGFKIYKIIPFI